MELDWCHTGSPSSREGMQELFNWGVRGEHRFLLLLAVPEGRSHIPSDSETLWSCSPVLFFPEHSHMALITWIMAPCAAAFPCCPCLMDHTGLARAGCSLWSQARP